MGEGIFAGVTSRVTLPRHVIVAFSAWASRIVSAGAQLLVIRLVLPILGEADFARFSVVTGLLVWFLLVEFGLGPSVQNALAESAARGGSAGAVLRAAATLGSIILVLALAILWLSAAPAQRMLFRQLGQPGAGDAHVLALVGTVLVVTTIANISTRVFYGDLRGELANAYIAASYVASLAAVMLAVRHLPATGRLLWVLLAWTLPRALVCVGACLHVGVRFRVWASSHDPAAVSRLWQSSWKFGGFSVLSAGVLGLDYVVMSQTLRPAEIVEYSVATKVLTLAIFFYGSFRDAAWPVATFALTRGEVEPVRRLTNQLLALGFVLVALGTVVFALFNGRATALLAGSSSAPVRVGVIMAIGGYFALRVWSDTFAMILQSRGVLRVFWLYVPFQALVSAVAQYTLSKRYGVYGIVAGVSLSFVATAVWILPVAYETLLARSAERRTVPV